jgi:hypothetical protein
MKGTHFCKHCTCVMSNREATRVIPNGSNFSPIEEGWTTQIIGSWEACYRAGGREQNALTPLSRLTP